jgi:hypothetical protein
MFFAAPFVVGGELIAPTRSLESMDEKKGSVSVLSEPPEKEAFLDGEAIGKTPVWYREVAPGYHRLRVQSAEIDIFVEPGKHFQIGLFKETFLIIPEKEKTVPEWQAKTGEKDTIKRRSPGGGRQERPSPDLSSWERFINGSSPVF